MPFESSISSLGELSLSSPILSSDSSDYAMSSFFSNGTYSVNGLIMSHTGVNHYTDVPVDSVVKSLMSTPDGGLYVAGGTNSRVLMASFNGASYWTKLLSGTNPIDPVFSFTEAVGAHYNNVTNKYTILGHTNSYGPGLTASFKYNLFSLRHSLNGTVESFRTYSGYTNRAYDFSLTTNGPRLVGVGSITSTIGGSGIFDFSFSGNLLSASIVNSTVQQTQIDAVYDEFFAGQTKLYSANSQLFITYLPFNTTIDSTQPSCLMGLSASMVDFRRVSNSTNTEIVTLFSSNNLGSLHTESAVIPIFFNNCSYSTRYPIVKLHHDITASRIQIVNGTLQIFGSKLNSISGRNDFFKAEVPEGISITELTSCSDFLAIPDGVLSTPQKVAMPLKSITANITTTDIPVNTLNITDAGLTATPVTLTEEQSCPEPGPTTGGASSTTAFYPPTTTGTTSSLPALPHDSSDNNNSLALLLGIPGVGLLLLLVFFFAVLYRRRNQRHSVLELSDIPKDRASFHATELNALPAPSKLTDAEKAILLNYVDDVGLIGQFPKSGKGKFALLPDEVHQKAANLLHENTGANLKPSDNGYVTQIGQGAFGRIVVGICVATYKNTSTISLEPGDPLAIKLVEDPSKMAESEQEIQFHKDAAAVPNFMPLIDANNLESKGKKGEKIRTMIMPLMGGDGEKLKVNLQPMHPEFKYKVITHVFKELLIAYRDLHEPKYRQTKNKELLKPLVHLDGKPANFMVNNKGRVLLSDAGSGTTTTDAGVPDNDTKIDVPHASPEELLSFGLNAKIYDNARASDIFKCLLTMAELILGEYPFKKVYNYHDRIPKRQPGESDEAMRDRFYQEFDAELNKVIEKMRQKGTPESLLDIFQSAFIADWEQRQTYTAAILLESGAFKDPALSFANTDEMKHAFTEVLKPVDERVAVAQSAYHSTDNHRHGGTYHTYAQSPNAPGATAHAYATSPVPPSQQQPSAYTKSPSDKKVLSSYAKSPNVRVTLTTSTHTPRSSASPAAGGGRNSIYTPPIASAPDMTQPRPGAPHLQSAPVISYANNPAHFKPIPPAAHTSTGTYHTTGMGMGNTGR